MNSEPLTILGRVLTSHTIMSGHQNTIVFVHGIGVAANYFMPLARLLSTDYDVVVLDLPGYGNTPKPAHALTIEELALTVKGVVAYYGLTFPILVGQSMGCQIVACLLRAEPTCAVKAILISPSTNKAERTVPMQAFRLLQDVFHETLRMDIITFTDYIRMGVGRFLKTARYMVADAIEDNLAQVSAPVLFIRGGGDKIVPQGWIEYLTTITPSAQLVVHPRAPHNLHYVKAELVAADIREFIR